MFDWNYLEWFAKVWKPTDPPMIVVNPGSLCEAFLPSAPPHSAAWAHYGQTAPARRSSMRLRTLHFGGPLHGSVAHGLACGALLCVSNGSIWNAMAWHGTGYPGERKRLREWRGITTRGQWQPYLHDLLDCEQHSSVWDFTGYWRQTAANVIRARSEGSVVVTEDGVTKTDPRPESEIEAQIEGVQRPIGRITRYEARLRVDAHRILMSEPGSPWLNISFR
jgi:hypothetical protein